MAQSGPAKEPKMRGMDSVFAIDDATRRRSLEVATSEGDAPRHQLENDAVRNWT